jgi:SAM-dependent methyltransferase
MGIPLSIDPSKRPHELYEDIDYRVFWAGWQQCKLDQAEHAVVRDLLPVSGRRLIDIGCGFGRLADCYLDRFQQVVMFDGSLSLLQQARDNTGGRAIYVAGDLHHLPFRASTCDSVVMVRVFHHVADSQACLAELHRVLAGGGCLVVTFRNKLYFMRILKWLIHPTSNSPFSRKPADTETTLISHHPAYVKQALLQTGFTGLQYRGLGVLDRLANRLGPFGRYAPTGRRSARLFGRVLIAPWIFCRAVAGGHAPRVESSNLDDLFMCLGCGGNLESGTGEYTCHTCGRRYPITDGILDFRSKLAAE